MGFHFSRWWCGGYGSGTTLEYLVQYTTTIKCLRAVLFFGGRRGAGTMGVGWGRRSIILGEPKCNGHKKHNHDDSPTNSSIIYDPLPMHMFSCISKKSICNCISSVAVVGVEVWALLARRHSKGNSSRIVRSIAKNFTT